MKLNYKNKYPLYIPYSGTILTGFPLFNKGSAFSIQERQEFNLHGLLPEVIETIEEQAERSWLQFKNCKTSNAKYIYLRNIQDTNETLFYRLIENHLEEMMPIIYTPTVGIACEYFSEIYRRARGLFISYPNSNYIENILHNVIQKEVKVIVVTDGERILSLGDQGIGGMGIPIGKLSLYTACGGIDPSYTLPILLDVGTNNKKLLKNPLYMGWRHPRITGEKYHNFIAKFIAAVKNRWPKVLIQFEDFSQKNAMPILEKYRNKICCFNDDIQGTAAVTVGTLIAASYKIGTPLCNQKIVFLGAGSAGCGIAEQIIAHMVAEGISDHQARSQIFMVDKLGLLTDVSLNLFDFQKKLVQNSKILKNWHIYDSSISLLDVINNVSPSILIGVSGQPGLFTKEIISKMYQYCMKPIIMPLSNPTSCVEALPADIIDWTNGNALIATGSPFKPVMWKDKKYHIAQCNNSYIFPGIGLGVIATGAQRITDSMLMAASKALADCSLLTNNQNSILPAIKDIQYVSKKIALAVGKAAQIAGVAIPTSEKFIIKSIEDNFWIPAYYDYKRTAI